MFTITIIMTNRCYSWTLYHFLLNFKTTLVNLLNQEDWEIVKKAFPVKKKPLEMLVFWKGITFIFGEPFYAFDSFIGGAIYFYTWLLTVILDFIIYRLSFTLRKSLYINLRERVLLFTCFVSFFPSFSAVITYHEIWFVLLT